MERTERVVIGYNSKKHVVLEGKRFVDTTSIGVKTFVVNILKIKGP